MSTQQQRTKSINPIDEVFKWAKYAKHINTDIAQGIYDELKRKSDTVYSSAKSKKDESQLKSSMGKTYTVRPTGCKLYEVIKMAKDFKVQGSDDALKEYQQLKQTEQMYQNTLDTQKVGGRSDDHLNKDAVENKQKAYGMVHTSSTSNSPKTRSKNFAHTVHTSTFPDSQRSNVKERDPSPSLARDKMVTVPKDKYDTLTNTVELQDAKIKELISRLSRVASDQLTDGNPNISDLSDKNRPSKLGEKFAELYDNEWTDAFEDLMGSRSGMKEDDVAVLLFEIVMATYKFCEDNADLHLRRLNDYLEMVATEPKFVMNKQGYKVHRDPLDPTHLACSHKYARNFRKDSAMATVPALCVLFTDVAFRDKFPDLELGKLPENFTVYIKKCVELIWLMCVQEPPMKLEWQKPGEIINKDVYKLYKTKGQTVKSCVWPAVYLHNDGALVTRGHVLPT